MNNLYIVAGIVSLILGLFIIIHQIRIFSKGKQDQLGFDIKLLGGGVIFVMVGIGILIKYL